MLNVPIQLLNDRCFLQLVGLDRDIKGVLDTHNILPIVELLGFSLLLPSLLFAQRLGWVLGWIEDRRLDGWMVHLGMGC